MQITVPRNVAATVTTILALLVGAGGGTAGSHLIWSEPTKVVAGVSQDELRKIINGELTKVLETVKANEQRSYANMTELARSEDVLRDARSAVRQQSELASRVSALERAQAETRAQYVKILDKLDGLVR